MIKKKKIASCVVLMTSLLFGCGGNDTIVQQQQSETEQQLEAAFYAMAEEFQQLYEPCDRMAEAYNQALDALHTYIEDGSEEMRLETLRYVQECSETIKNQSIPDYTMSEEVKAFLNERGIPESEFLAVSEKRLTDQQDYIQRLENYEQNLSEFIANMGIIPMTLKVMVDYQKEIHQCESMWMSYAANEIFLSLEEEEIDYMKENVFSSWKFYYPEEMIWQEEASYALQKQEEYWNREITLLNQMTQEAGALINSEYGEVYGYIVDKDGNITILRYLGEDSKIELPEGIQNNPVTAIYPGAFRNTNIKEVFIPASVQTLGEGIFEGCEGVTIYGEKGSAAERYAKENDIPFQVKEAGE